MLSPPEFIPGRELSRLFWSEAVQPVIEAKFPNIQYAAGLLGPGSDVLGFDTAMSMDHGWGPRVQLFLEDEDASSSLVCRISDVLSKELPRSFHGFPTSCTRHADGSLCLTDADGPVAHDVAITTPATFFREYLAIDLFAAPRPADWLTMPEQKLRTVSTGPIFHDEIGLSRHRSRFLCFPSDVWLYLLSCGWNRIGQEEALVGRAGYVGDELGAAIIASRLVRDMMRLCFLLERTYAPYPKWFGTAFAQLESAAELSPLFEAVQRASGWRERDACLKPAYEAVARIQNRLNLVVQRPAEARYFHGRPFHAIELWSEFSNRLRAQIIDPEVREIALRRPIGSIDQFSDSTDLLCAEFTPILRTLFETNARDEG